MMKDNIKISKMNNAFSEVYDIICHMDENLKNKISPKFIKIIKDNRNEEYKVNIDYSKNINNQNILHDTKVILSVIYRDFLVNNQTKLELQKKDRLAIEEKYNPDNIFKKSNNINKIEEQINNDKLPIEITKESFFSKIVNFIKKILK